MCAFLCRCYQGNNDRTCFNHQDEQLEGLPLSVCVCERGRECVCVSISAVCCNKFVQLVSLSGSVVTGDKRDEDTFI